MGTWQQERRLPLVECLPDGPRRNDAPGPLQPAFGWLLRCFRLTCHPSATNSLSHDTRQRHWWTRHWDRLLLLLAVRLRHPRLYQNRHHTITTAEGSSVHRFMVIGNPCKQANRIPSEAPEVRCSAQGELIGAPVSDNGYIILAKFFDDDGLEANDDTVFAGHCEQRKNAGYNSGMGEIFRKVAGISTITPVPSIGHTGSDSNSSDEPSNMTEL